MCALIWIWELNSSHYDKDTCSLLLARLTYLPSPFDKYWLDNLGNLVGIHKDMLPNYLLTLVIHECPKLTPAITFFHYHMIFFVAKYWCSMTLDNTIHIMSGIKKHTQRSPQRCHHKPLILWGSTPRGPESKLILKRGVLLYEKPQHKNPNQHIFNIQYKQDLLLAIQFRRLDSSSQFFTNSRTAKFVWSDILTTFINHSFLFFFLSYQKTRKALRESRPLPRQPTLSPYDTVQNDKESF